MRTLAFIAVLLFTGPLLAAGAATAAAPTPQAATYEVWGYRWDGRQYERQPNYNFSTADIRQAANYAAQIDSYPGWTATTNIPPASRPVVHSTAGGRIVHGARGDTIHVPTISVGGWTFRLPNVRIPAGLQVGEATESSSFDYGSTYGDTSQIDQSNALQDQINQQQMNDNEQELLNEQNFENTENMINSQNAVNAQMGP